MRIVRGCPIQKNSYKHSGLSVFEFQKLHPILITRTKTKYIKPHYFVYKREERYKNYLVWIIGMRYKPMRYPSKWCDKILIRESWGDTEEDVKSFINFLNKEVGYEKSS